MAQLFFSAVLAQFRRSFFTCVVLSLALLAFMRAQQPTVSAATQDSQLPLPLELGKPIEREIGGGQTHTYQVMMGLEEFLRVSVDQRGIDVVVTLFSPDGKKMLAVDSPNGAWGPEPCLWVAETAGIYRLEIDSPDKSALAGRYEIQMTERRNGKATDRDLVEALNLYFEANKLLNQLKYQEAITLAQRALVLRENALGPDHSDLAPTLHQLARLYARVADVANAEKFFQRALPIYEHTFGSQHPEMATILNNFAMLEYGRANFTKAAMLLERAIEVLNKLPGTEGSLVPSLCNLGQMYYFIGNHSKAELLYQRGVVIGERALGKENPYLSYCLTNLGNLYNTHKRFAEAEPVFQRALEIRQKVLPPGHPDIGVTLQGLGTTYLQTEQLDQAKSMFQQAIPILEKSPGQLLFLVNCLELLGRIELSRGNRQLALPLFTRAVDTLNRFISNSLMVSSERQKVALMNIVSTDLNVLLSLQSQQDRTDVVLLELALTRLFQNKGRILDMQADTIGKIRNRAIPEDQTLFSQLMETRSRLAKMELNGRGRETPEAYRAGLKQTEENLGELELELSRRSLEYSVQTKAVTLTSVKAAIPENSALLEFALYKPLKSLAGELGQSRYIVYAISKNDQPRWADIGEATAIDRAIEAWRRALRDPKQSNVRRLARAVDEKVMRPVRALLGDAKHLLIAPDGKLNLIPFAALVDERNRFLIENYSISYLTSGRDLLRLQVVRESKSEPVILADPAFGISTIVSESGLKNERDQLVFNPLPVSADEADGIKKQWPNAKVLMQRQATEEAIKQLTAPRFLHIATHGFFLNDQEPPPENSRGLAEDPLRMPDARLAKWAERIENPLLRSGIALAGANLHKSGGDDGILTALEAAALNLWGTKLVVLSACDTGVGEIKNGEGVYGLRRALILAGAETLVMSLWPVEDKATKGLMVSYYSALARGEGRGEALRQIQLKLIRSKHRHPFYWASFIQLGEWANLEGKREVGK